MKKLLTKKDVIFIVCLVVIGFAFALISHFTSKGETAAVRVDGEIVEKIDLTDTEYYEKTFNGVTVVRENGEVYIKSSTCPDKVCVRAGKLQKSGESAICVPNRVSVEIVSEKSNNVDALTG